MEIRVLRYFLEVAREGNITRAAAYLHISQPTLSRQIKELEEELGKKLFVRSNYSVKLTEEGMLLRPSDLIFANEVIGYLETLVKGFPVDRDALAEDLIDEVGPGGTYLMEEHTMEHLYSFWTPDKLEPRKLGDGASLEQDLAEAALAIIEKGPQHPLSPGKQQVIDTLMDNVRAKSKKMTF